MKKLLLLFMAIVLLSGCASIGVAPGERVANDYAYVVGQKSRSNGNSFAFSHVSNSGKMYAAPETTFILPEPSSDSSYFIQKVRPGQYVFEYSILSGGGKSTAKLGTVILEPGKINYIGTLNVDHRMTGSTLTTESYQLTPKVTYQPDAVKEILKKKYPQMAQDINDKFVVQPLR